MGSQKVGSQILAVLGCLGRVWGCLGRLAPTYYDIRLRSFWLQWYININSLILQLRAHHALKGSVRPFRAYEALGPFILGSFEYMWKHEQNIIMNKKHETHHHETYL